MTVCSTVHTVVCVRVVTKGASARAGVFFVSEAVPSHESQGRHWVDVRVIMLWSTRVAVKVSVVKWVVRVRSAAADASPESAGWKWKRRIS